MTKNIRDVMTPNPVSLPSTTSLREAAQTMKDRDIGNVLVEDGGSLCGLVTDRDIVVRAVADGRDPAQTTLSDVCSHDLITVTPDETIANAAKLMGERAVRRLPVVEGGKAVGVVSIGDLAIAADPKSALADLSDAPPND